MIDPHVHLRDWDEAYKETLAHGLKVAYDAGLVGVFEMPNTKPPIIDRKTVIERINQADACGIPIFHGIYMGLTKDAEQIKNAVKLYNEFTPRVVGFKLFAGSGTGLLGINDKESQRLVFTTLKNEGFKGVIAVHCEKESLIRKDLWDYTYPFSHTISRSPESEIESVRDILSFALESSFGGTVHICHISLPQSVNLIEDFRKMSSLNITCGITPHHMLLEDNMMKAANGILLKMNPPLRSKDARKRMMEMLFEGKIDWIETDHAPHTLKDKTDPQIQTPFLSGIPGLPFYPRFLKMLRERGMHDELLRNLTFNNIIRTFKISVLPDERRGSHNLHLEYAFDPFGRFIV